MVLVEFFRRVVVRRVAVFLARAFGLDFELFPLGLFAEGKTVNK